VTASRGCWPTLPISPRECRLPSRQGKRRPHRRSKLLRLKRHHLLPRQSPRRARLQRRPLELPSLRLHRLPLRRLKLPSRRLHRPLPRRSPSPKRLRRRLLKPPSPSHRPLHRRSPRRQKLRCLRRTLSLLRLPRRSLLRKSRRCLRQRPTQRRAQRLNRPQPLPTGRHRRVSTSQAGRAGP